MRKNSCEIKIGDKIGKYEVMQQLPSKKYKSGSKRTFLCKCDCGNTNQVQIGNLISNKSTRCRSCRIKSVLQPFNDKKKQRNDSLINQNQCYKTYKRQAQRRNLQFEIGFEQFIEITQQRCNYCNIQPCGTYNLKFSNGKRKGQSRAGLPFIYNGVDRKNNMIGYTSENCVPCCAICNRAKSKSNIQDFKTWITKVYNNLNKG